MHVTWQANSGGHVSVASAHVASPEHSILHTSPSHPPLHSGGHSPPGGVGSTPHSMGPVVVAVVSAEELEPELALEEASDGSVDASLASPVLVAVDDPDPVMGPLDASLVADVSVPAAVCAVPPSSAGQPTIASNEQANDAHLTGAILTHSRQLNRAPARATRPVSP